MQEAEKGANIKTNLKKSAYFANPMLEHRQARHICRTQATL